MPSGAARACFLGVITYQFAVFLKAELAILAFASRNPRQFPAGTKLEFV